MRGAPFDGWVKRDGPLEVFYPRNTDPGFTTSIGAAWAWPAAYDQIVAATAEAFVPNELYMGINLVVLTSGSKGVWLEYELATGAVGSEVVIHRHTDVIASYMINPGATTQNLVFFGRSVPVGPKLIPSGTRLSHRVRCSLIDTAAVTQILMYLGGYVGGGAPVAHSPYGFRPHLAGVHEATSDISVQGDSYAIITPASWAGGVYSAPVTVIDPAPADLIIHGVAWRETTLSASMFGYYLAIGTGAAGSEVKRRIVGIPLPGFYGQVGMLRLRYPVFVKKGERVSICGMGTAPAQRVKLLWESR